MFVYFFNKKILTLTNLKAINPVKARNPNIAIPMRDPSKR